MAFAEGLIATPKQSPKFINRRGRGESAEAMEPF